MRATVTLALHRHRGRSVQFSDLPPRERAPSRRPARIAQLLALAHHQRAIDRGTFASQSDVARRLGLTTARVTQVMNLLLLAPDIQESLLFSGAIDGVEPVNEKALRQLSRERAWTLQRRLAPH